MERFRNLAIGLTIAANLQGCKSEPSYQPAHFYSETNTNRQPFLPEKPKPKKKHKVKINHSRKINPHSPEKKQAELTETSVPIERNGNHLYGIVDINGKPVKMLLDTGAYHNHISFKDAQRIGLVTDMAGLNENCTVGAFHAESQLNCRHTIVSMAMGHAKVSQIELTILPDSAKSHIAAVDNLLAGEFFKHFKVTFDYKNNKAHLSGEEKYFRSTPKDLNPPEPTIKPQPEIPKAPDEKPQPYKKTVPPTRIFIDDTPPPRQIEKASPPTRTYIE